MSILKSRVGYWKWLGSSYSQERKGGCRGYIIP